MYHRSWLNLNKPEKKNGKTSGIIDICIEKRMACSNATGTIFSCQVISYTFFIQWCASWTVLDIMTISLIEHDDVMDVFKKCSLMRHHKVILVSPSDVKVGIADNFVLKSLCEFYACHDRFFICLFFGFCFQWIKPLNSPKGVRRGPDHL